MKVAMAMTLDGLLRSLRWKAHDLAENTERRYRTQPRTPLIGEDISDRAARRMGDQDDDRTSR
ncbi:hypothetical protein G6N74_05985 [Mesorhizobium sp. CGMCC 1.15528]|uniref:Uncharacterized protein n=1 Tax=Mesorhizobium zhangyense TaxID=1776730 RepID=A0A7C9VA26_9HYPH|nr:hypothetical protein [Mesorhizobium zhangyense]NGN40607.1 hypothetical protein [Mesorhizobium zhangyense]